MKYNLKYILLIFLIHLVAEFVMFSCEIYYYNICCKNFQTFVIMKSSTMCKKMRSINYYIDAKRIFTNILS
jgi:hypothetical protein